MNKAKRKKILQRARAVLGAAPSKTVYSTADVTELYRQIQQHEQIPQLKFIEVLVEHGLLQEATFKSIYQSLPHRFVKERFSSYELALSLYRASYLSHETAAFLHGLMESEPNTVYVNKEQSVKPRPDPESLTQETLNNAFSGKQRTSRFVLSYKHARITILRGKPTARLGVEALKVNEQSLDVTSVERTLIDITVRPGYAGGVQEVLKCYVAARTHASPKRLVGMLRELDYVYPYYQAVGFYMQKTGYVRTSWAELQQELRVDFFLAHGMKKQVYDPEWRIFYPNDLQI